MNWEVVSLLFLILAIFAAMVLTAVLFIRHWSSRAERHDHVVNDPTEGRYFRRYVPPELRSKYDAIHQQGSRTRLRQHRALTLLFNLVVFTAAFAVVGISAYANRDKIWRPAELDGQLKLDDIDYSESLWLRSTGRTPIRMADLLPDLKKRKFILVGSEKDFNWEYHGYRYARTAKGNWSGFLNEYNLPYSTCSWEAVEQCWSSNSRAIFIVLPGYWDLAKADQMIRKGAAVIFYGPPAQIFTDHASEISWHDMRFQFQPDRDNFYLALRGDQVLTLGFDAGQILEATPSIPNYRVLSDIPQALAITSDRMVGGEVETRLFAGTVGKGRFVWLDFSPFSGDYGGVTNLQMLDSVDAAVLRYLLGKSYSSWATWPQGRRYSGLISEDTEDHYQNAQSVVELVKKHHYPITWFALSNEAILNRDLTNEMMKVGEIACHGDNHALFPKQGIREQVRRLARCQKVLEVITGKHPEGFRPPEEDHNNSTVNAIWKVGMSYYFAENGSDRSVPVIRKAYKHNGTLVSIPRNIVDDYELWHALKLNYNETISLVDNELSWMESVGGLYAFSFHSQYMNDDDHLKVIARIGDRLDHDDCFFATAKEIADWWRVRVNLIHGNPVKESQLRHFDPVKLTVNADGNLVRESYRSDIAALTIPKAQQ